MRVGNRSGLRPDKHPNHISGVSAGGLVLFVFAIVALGIWAAEQGLTAAIDTVAGSIVIFGLAGAFLFLALAPFFPPSLVGRTAGKNLSRGACAVWMGGELDR